MKLYIEDLLREINILNWYRGEAAKRVDISADLVQSGSDQQDALKSHIRSAVTDILLFANSNRVKFTCEVADDALNFSLEPLRAGREYMKDILREAIRQYIIYEVRRLWMMMMRPEWADASLREELRQNIKSAMSAVTAGGERIRRRPTDLAGI